MSGAWNAEQLMWLDVCCVWSAEEQTPCWRRWLQQWNSRPSTVPCGAASWPALPCVSPGCPSFCCTSIASCRWRTSSTSWATTLSWWYMTTCCRTITLFSLVWLKYYRINRVTVSLVTIVPSVWPYWSWMTMSLGCDQVEAVSTSVQDSSVLVQRSTLDLILFCFPFHMSQVHRTFNPQSLSSCSGWVEPLSNTDTLCMNVHEDW